MDNETTGVEIPIEASIPLRHECENCQWYFERLMEMEAVSKTLYAVAFYAGLMAIVMTAVVVAQAVW